MQRLHYVLPILVLTCLSADVLADLYIPGLVSSSGVSKPVGKGRPGSSPHSRSRADAASQREISGESTRTQTAEVDGDFYAKYQHAVLASRKPFAVDKGFITLAIQVHAYKKLWLDAGAGTCGTMHYLEEHGIDVLGVELSPSQKTECGRYLPLGKVKAAPLHEIPYDDNQFDLVWSSEVLEHVPSKLVFKSVAELVRVAKKDLFLTIAMKRSGFDPPFPEPPKVHITVMPRKWWDAVFKIHGCTVNVPVRQQFNAMYGGTKATFFPYICDKANKLYVAPECVDAVHGTDSCVVNAGGDMSACNEVQRTVDRLCEVE